VLTALVVDADADARRRVAGLLHLAGWQVHQAAGIVPALTAAADLDSDTGLDLVVTDAALPGGSGPALLRRLRATGSRARFLVVTAEPTDDVRAESAAAGALACVAKPVDADVLLNFLRSRATGLAAQENTAELRDNVVVELDDLHPADADAELMARLHDMYASALPGRLSAITSGARSGDAPRVASAAYTLAGTSGQLGHPEVAELCQAIAHDARRGVLAHARLVQLQEAARV
jgi:DNA-binding NtrC family response regulator